MNENPKIPMLTINWKFEKYLYSHSFNLEEIGKFISKVSKNNIELPDPNYLYKFFSNESYNLESLEKGYLYFSNPKNFNDPFDCLSNREKYIINNAQNKEGIKNHRDNIGVCCFSLVNKNPLMWGHYTKNYKGFCIKFENISFLNSKNIGIKTHVSYLKKYLPVNDELRNAIIELNENKLNIELNMKDNIHKILTMLFEYSWKFKDWKYEKEYRAISINSNSFDRKLDFDKNHIKEVYIGFRMKTEEPEFYKKLLDILKSNYPEAKILEVKPNPLLVKLDFHSIFE
jgi:hypothetical protein